MKLVLGIIAVHLATIACIVMAGLMALNDKDGWGWFLLIGVLLSGGSVSTTRGNSNA